VRALFWPPFVRSAWAHPTTAVAGITGEGAGLASVRLAGVGSVTGGEPIGKGVGLVSPLFVWLAWGQLLWWRADMQGRWSGPLSPLFPWSVWAQSLWWRADMQGRWSGPL
jgi:hypothetical protein